MNITFFTRPSASPRLVFAALPLVLASQLALAADGMDQARALIQPSVQASDRSPDRSARSDPHQQAVRLILAGSASELKAPLQPALERSRATVDPHQQARDLIQAPRLAAHRAPQPAQLGDVHAQLVIE